MIDRPRVPGRARLLEGASLAAPLLVNLGAVLLTCLAAGCTQPASQLRITSYKDPYFPEQFTLSLDDAAYRVDGHGDYHVAASTTAALPGSMGAAHSESGEPVEQYLTLQFFWRPRPGKTGDDRSLTNAIIGYAIVTPAGAAVYRGTAYAYPYRSRVDDTIRFELEDARLRLEHAVGDAPEVLGEARATGRLHARPDGQRVVRCTNEVARLAALPRWPEPPDE